jgi:hypothetical protein
MNWQHFGMEKRNFTISQAEHGCVAQRKSGATSRQKME